MGGSAEPRATASCLRGADACALAFDGARLVGFTTAMSDGALFVFMGDMRALVIGEVGEHWDTAALVEYPSDS